MEDRLILVDKPEGITTFDIIRNLKKKYPKGTKIGHTGTLDPFATGLVIILLGAENKKQEYYHTLSKTYVVNAIFNAQTDTLDRTGIVINRNDKVLTEVEINNTIEKHFLGKIMQIPPRFSAKHVNGKRAYDLAREGVEFEIKPSEVEIFSFKVLDFKFPSVVFEIKCGSGTYIRSLISDLAVSLGTFAYCDQLRRTEIGEFNVNDAIKLT